MIEYIALTNFFSFKERTEFSLKATKEKPRGTFSGEDWWTEIDGIKLLKAKRHRVSVCPTCPSCFKKKKKTPLLQ